jgi:hypothetical protein
MSIGERILIGNSEDITDLKVLELSDVYEVSPAETYFEFIEYDIICRRSREKPGL